MNKEIKNFFSDVFANIYDKVQIDYLYPNSLINLLKIKEYIDSGKFKHGDLKINFTSKSTTCMEALLDNHPCWIKITSAGMDAFLGAADVCNIKLLILFTDGEKINDKKLYDRFTYIIGDVINPTNAKKYLVDNFTDEMKIFSVLNYYENLTSRHRYVQHIVDEFKNFINEKQRIPYHDELDLSYLDGLQKYFDRHKKLDCITEKILNDNGLTSTYIMGTYDQLCDLLNDFIQTYGRLPTKNENLVLWAFWYEYAYERSKMGKNRRYIIEKHQHIIKYILLKPDESKNREKLIY